MDVADSSDQFNYFIDGFGTVGVTFDASGQTATVNLDNPLTAGTTYQMQIQNTPDLSGNVIVTTNVSFTAGNDLPQLTISLSGGQAVISWPAPSTGFNLQETSAIVSPASAIVWSPITTPAPTVINGRNTVSLNAATSGSRFYRLSQ
jgi:hypothetical protein